MILRNLALGGSAAVVAVLVAVPSFAQGLGWGADKADRPELGERHNQMVQVIESADYGRWKELMGDRPVADKITAENFPQFAEMAQLFHGGDVEAANEIRKGLDLAPRGLHSGKMMRGKGMKRQGRGNGQGPRFVDANGDGVCDRQDWSETQE